MSLEVFVLGTGGMMPLPHRFLTSVLLRREGDLFLFDCGEATQISLKKLNLGWKKISAIFISHTHADHVTGLPGLLMLSSQVERDEPLYIYGPPKIKDYIESSKKTLDMYINYEIIVREIDPELYNDGLFKGDGFQINSFPLRHTKPCVGYSLVEDSRPGVFDPQKARDLNVPVGPKWSYLQKGESVEASDGSIVEPGQVLGPKRSGRKFSFVTDTSYMPSISNYVTNSDLLICESMFTADLVEDAAKKMHLTSVQAARIANDAGGIDKMGLIHYSPRYVTRELKQMQQEASTIFPNTFLCKDGMSLVVPNKD
ncbi:MAG: ribonuclease Z [Spirochaetales bacterium]|nr:ribonuclease Z [Spirochaetales bacterium]